MSWTCLQKNKKDVILLCVCSSQEAKAWNCSCWVSKVNRNSQPPVCTQQVAGCTNSFLLLVLEEPLLSWSDVYLSLEEIFADAGVLCKAARQLWKQNRLSAGLISFYQNHSSHKTRHFRCRAACFFDWVLNQATAGVAGMVFITGSSLTNIDLILPSIC